MQIELHIEEDRHEEQRICSASPKKFCERTIKDWSFKNG